MPSGVPNFRYRDAVDRPTFDRTRLDPNDDEEIELEVNTGGEYYPTHAFLA